MSLPDLQSIYTFRSRPVGVEGCTTWRLLPAFANLMMTCVHDVSRLPWVLHRDSSRSVVRLSGYPMAGRKITLP